jgi:hypothetical protein
MKEGSEHNFRIPKENNKKYLSEIISLLKRKYEGKTIKIPVKDTNSKISVINDVPSFLFRGEAQLYDTTKPTVQRLMNSRDLDITFDDANILLDLTKCVDKKFNKHIIQDHGLSSSYVQHYGLYTELLDFTSSLDVCALFSTSLKCERGPGRICVADTKTLIQKAIVIDLTTHPYAERPRRQHAFAVYCNEHLDFKDQDCIHELNLNWFEFQKNDYSKNLGHHDLFRTSDDKVAGLMALTIDECIDEMGKIPHNLAIHLANKINRVPVFGVIDGDFSGEIYSADDLNIQIDFEAERDYSIKKWSDRYKEEPLPTIYNNYIENGWIRILRLNNITLEIKDKQ